MSKDNSPFIQWTTFILIVFLIYTIFVAFKTGAEFAKAPVATWKMYTRGLFDQAFFWFMHSVDVVMDKILGNGYVAYVDYQK